MEHSLDSATSAALCTQTIMSQAEACYNCNAKYGADKIAYLQNDINTFVASCAELGVSLKSVTVVAKSAGERLLLGISGPVVGLAALFLVLTYGVLEKWDKHSRIALKDIENYAELVSKLMMEWLQEEIDSSDELYLLHGRQEPQKDKSPTQVTSCI
ncbi:hypothetical protein B0H14DRAFT_3594635 [Mycena olivaceomarginata]|nr:hypothetical protein B0H14DRAFT_3594635 [Mycena olivaceomarginata]